MHHQCLPLDPLNQLTPLILFTALFHRSAAAVNEFTGVFVQTVTEFGQLLDHWMIPHLSEPVL